MRFTVEGPVGPWNQLRQVSAFVRNYPEALLAAHRAHGDVVRMYAPAKGLAFFHPRHVRHILKSSAKNYPKSRVYEALRPILGNGVFISDGDFWARQRRLLAPEFRENEVRRFLPVIIEKTEALLEEWERASREGATRDITDDMMNLTIQIVGGTLFRSDLAREAADIGHALEVCLAQATLQYLSKGLLRPWMPTPGNLRARRAQRLLDGKVRDIIAHGRAGEVGKIDMLSRLLHAVDAETGQQMDDQQILDEVKNLLLAGHETTSLNFSWTFQALALEPEIERKLVEEVTRVLGGGPFRAEMIPDLVYTRAVLFETMRLYPPVPSVSREVLEEEEVDGVRIAPGELIQVAPYVTHRHPELWDSPMTYQPERFLGERAERIEPYGYLPFLRGRRACLGEHFAMLEGVVGLAMMVQRFHLEAATPVPIPAKPISTLRFGRPLLMRVVAR